jgi:hypothetical protein
MAQAATAIEQRQPVEAVIERADALEGPDPAHHLDGGGSGGEDDEVGEVMAQVFGYGEWDPAAPHAGLGQGGAGVGGDQNGVWHWRVGSNCYLANSSAIPAAGGDLSDSHGCDQAMPQLWDWQGHIWGMGLVLVGLLTDRQGAE